MQRRTGRRFIHLPYQRGQKRSRSGCRSCLQVQDGMPIKIRVMPDCIVITTQNTRELYGCAEGLSVAYVNRQKMKLWLEGFPEILNDIGDLPVYRRERRTLYVAADGTIQSDRSGRDLR
jgi:toxic protein SymE